MPIICFGADMLGRGEAAVHAEVQGWPKGSRVCIRFLAEMRDRESASNMTDRAILENLQSETWPRAAPYRR